MEMLLPRAFYENKQNPDKSNFPEIFAEFPFRRSENNIMIAEFMHEELIIDAFALVMNKHLL